MKAVNSTKLLLGFKGEAKLAKQFFLFLSSQMDEKIAKADKEVLVELVKLAQKRGMKGDKGVWKEFLLTYDKKFGASLSDPSRRSNDVLVAFLKTFTNQDDLKFFDRVMESFLNRNLVERFKNKSRDNESPEQRLVRLTLEHPNYVLDYSFPSHEEDWTVTKLRTKFKKLKSTKMVAVDCEMVLCEDGTEALVKVCVVDHNLKEKLNELVKPNKAVVDYRTEITGVSAKSLDAITVTLTDIQKSMKRILSHGTILIGHSLNNDLKALKIDHARVIDTSYVFKYMDEPVFRKPSLNNLCKSVLGYQVRKEGAPHNCLDDARAAMKLVLTKLERGLDEVIPFTREDVPTTELAKLLLHRISIDVPSEELRRIIPGDYTIEVKPRKKLGGGFYSAMTTFKSPEEAHTAFESVAGSLEKDSMGRPQKLVSFELSTGKTSTLFIRTMVYYSSVTDHDSSKKRLSEAEDVSDVSKKLKTDQKGEAKEAVEAENCENHLKEIDSLKKILSQRDHEISVLHKIIASITRKQGL